MVDFGTNIQKCLQNEINDGKRRKKLCFFFYFQKQKRPNNNLPSVSKATSLLRGAHRPHLIGVGVRARSNGCRSYSLNRSSGDNALVDNGAIDVARISRGGTLNARAVDGASAGGTLTARDGRDHEPGRI